MCDSWLFKWCYFYPTIMPGLNSLETSKIPTLTDDYSSFRKSCTECLWGNNDSFRAPLRQAFAFSRLQRPIIRLNNFFCCPHCWLPIEKVPAVVDWHRLKRCIFIFPLVETNFKLTKIVIKEFHEMLPILSVKKRVVFHSCQQEVSLRLLIHAANSLLCYKHGFIYGNSLF